MTLFLIGKPWSAYVTPGPECAIRLGYDWIRACWRAVFWARTVEVRNLIIDPYTGKAANALVWNTIVTCV